LRALVVLRDDVEMADAQCGVLGELLEWEPDADKGVNELRGLDGGG
jgi:hypothetical protein